MRNNTLILVLLFSVTNDDVDARWMHGRGMSCALLAFLAFSGSYDPLSHSE